jgi:long-chain acyl-CoA synthetase
MTAEQAPDRLAVVADDGRITFAELVRRSDDLAAGLSKRGLVDGAVVSTDVPTGPHFFALALAALRHGYCLFPIPANRVGTALGDSLMAEMCVALHVTAGGAICGSVTDDELVAVGQREDRSAPAARSGWLVFVTSGTTGEPQAVTRARPSRRYRGVAVEKRYGAGLDCGPHVMTNPAYHLGTLGPALYALQAGSTVVVQRSWSPRAFADLVDLHRADSAMFSPDRLLDLVKAGQAPKRQMRVIFHGGSALPPWAKRAAIELLGPILHEYYGTSKGTLTEITTDEWLHHPGSVGRPLPGIELSIENAGQPVGPGEVGEVCVRPRAVDLDVGESDRWHTGDAGFLDASGYLHVVGRASTPGQLPLARLEYELRRVRGVFEVAVVGDPPMCYVEASVTGGLADMARAEAERLGIRLAGVRVRPPNSLPRTQSGKVQRTGLTAHPLTSQ